MKNCYGCPTAQTDKCLTCRTNENLDVSIRHGVTFPADGIPREVEPRTSAKPVPATLAAKPCADCPLTDFMFAMLDLDPVTLLLLLHRMRGGSLDGAGKWLAQVHDALLPWGHGMSRQAVHARLKGLKNPRLAQAASVMRRA